MLKRLKEYSRLKLIIAILGVIVLVVGIVVSIILVRRSQDIRRRAEYPCSECDGKLTHMTLRYLGGDSAQIRVVQRGDDAVVFNSSVDPNQEFSFSGVWTRNTLSTEIKIYVNDQFNTQIHTSCSDPNVVPGSTYGNFYIVAAKSRNGGDVCPLVQTPTPIPTVTIVPTNTPIPTASPTEKPKITLTPSPTLTPHPTLTTTPTPTTEELKACLGDRVVIDENQNGIQDEVEVGLGGVLVECFDEDDNLVASTTTDDEGFYQFCELVPGNYQVRFSVPQNYSLSSRYQGSDTTKDSNPSVSTSITESIALSAGDNDITIDALVYGMSIEITPTPTSTPTTTPTGTPKNTSTPTVVSTSTPTSTPTPTTYDQATATPTTTEIITAEELPDAGFIKPTVFLLVFALLLIMGSILFII